MVDSVQVFDSGFRVLDANGEPVNNAKIKFREAGPGATKTVYSDAALSTSLGHTVRTRADGYPVISEGSNTTCLIYVGSDDYNIEITDADDVAIFPAKDDVKGAVDTSTFVTSASTSVLAKPVLAKTSNYTLVAADKGKVIDCNAAGGFFTITMPDPTVVGDGWNIFIRNGGTANPVGISSSANINTPQGDMTAFSLRLGEAVSIACNGSAFKVDGYVPPLISGTTGVIVITDRITSAPGSPVAGERFIVTAGFSTYEAEDIIEANGQGGFFEITPAADCGWIAYVVDEDETYQFQGSAWVQLVTNAASQAVMETATSLLKAVTPGNQHFHPAHPKAWGYVTVSGGTPTLQTSHNVTSITDTGTGLLTVTIATDFSGANYAVLALLTTSNTDGVAGNVPNVRTGAQAAGSFQIDSRIFDNGTPAFGDPVAWHFAAFGDQA